LFVAAILPPEPRGEQKEGELVPSFQALVEQSSDVISLVDASGSLTYLSAASRRTFGQSPEELVGRSVYHLIHEDDQLELRRVLNGAQTRPAEPLPLEVRIRHQEGRWCWVECTVSSFLQDSDISGIMINWREIGLRRATREDKQEESNDLARSNVELEHFSYAVAHDLREPLRTISMFTEVLVKEDHLDERGKELAQFIIDGVTRVSTLFESLHAFAVRSFDQGPEPLDLGPVVAEALLNLQHAIATNHAVITVHPMPCVRGNHKQLLRVFQNLIINAIKYRGDGPPRILVSAERFGLDWIIKVRDQGIGIAPENHERVFRLLKRLHGAENPGAGFGLAICKKIVEELGGRIWVESEAGAGATFLFTIAASVQVPPPPLATAEPFKNGAGTPRVAATIPAVQALQQAMRSAGNR
jgi:PAS domain S-box-containing protein